MCLHNLIGENKIQLYYDFTIVKDLKNGISAEVKYNPSFDSSIGGVVSRYTLGWFKEQSLGHNKKANREARGDDVDIKIIKRANIDSDYTPHVL